MKRLGMSSESTTGVHLARVLAVTGRTATIEVPAVASGHQYLGVRYPDHLLDAGGGVTGTTRVASGPEPHQHGYGRPLAAQDQVLVAYVAGVPVVLSRLA